MAYTPEQLDDIQTKYAQADTRLKSVLAETDSKEKDLSRLVRETVLKEKYLRSLEETIADRQPKADALEKAISDLTDKNNAIEEANKKLNEWIEGRNRELTTRQWKVEQAELAVKAKQEEIAVCQDSIAKREVALLERQNKHAEATKKIIDHLNTHIASI